MGVAVASVGASDAPAALVGREEASRRLRAVLEDAHSGRGAAIVVSGPPGVGKSALLARVRAEATDCTVIASRGIETESEWAYAGLHQTLLPILHFVEEIPLAHRQAIEMAIGRADGAPEPMMVGMAVLGLLAEAAAEKTVLCILDDAHWLDQASKVTLQFAIRRLGADHVAVVAAQRIGVPGHPEWLPGDVEVIELAPFDLAIESELLAALVGEPVAAIVAARIHEVTGGLPLATKEMARALTVGQLTGRDPLPVRLPIRASLQRLFDPSLQLLSLDAHRLLLLAAADDSGVATPVLSAGRALGIAVSAFEELERSDLLRVLGNHLEFRHPLTSRIFSPSRIVALLLIALAAVGLAYLRLGSDGDSVSVPAGAKAGELTMHPCIYATENGSYEADCGTLVVLENRADPGSRPIALPVTRIRARSNDPAEPLFYLEGGPGITNMNFKQASRFADDHDVVLVGYRGVDGSVRLDCPEVESARSRSLYVVLVHAGAARTTSRTWVERCPAFQSTVRASEPSSV